MRFQFSCKTFTNKAHPMRTEKKYVKMGKANHMCSLLIVIKVSEVKTNIKIRKAFDEKS
jgi:hypothetical protein